MNRPLTSTSILVQDPDIISTDMDGETVMMSIEQGHYYGLGGIGPFLWEQMAEPVSIETLCDRVRARYAVDEATCRADVLAFVGDLLERGVVQHAG